MKYSVRYRLIILLCIGGVLSAFSQRRLSSYDAYIEKYHSIAEEHQARYGIPACITLAQALLESGAGESELSRKANNHFGIKCHDWKGRSVRYRGECYRKYDRVADSYRDHSEFLQRSRYSELFELRVTDYKGWARGLKRCGYAEDPRYASKLITIIEDYDLMQYVKGAKSKKKRNRYVDDTPLPRPVYRYWGLLYVLAEEGDTYARIAADMGFEAKDIAKYNEDDRDAILHSGEIVYLEKKKIKADAGYDTHTVAPGESLRSISQLYGIEYRRLARRNRIPFTEQVIEGQVLKLR